MNPLNLLMTSTKTGNVTDSNTAPGENTKDAPAFVTVQSLATFPGAAIAVGIVWKFFDAALGIDHRAVPIVTAFIVAVALWLIAISKQTSTTEKGVGLVLATINVDVPRAFCPRD